MKNKRIYVTLVTILFLLCTLFAHQILAQDAGNITFINTMADKPEVTLEDAFKFFIMIIGTSPQAYDGNLSELKNQNLIDQGFNIAGSALLKRGLLASMIARKLNLSDSLLYHLLDIERFALRACIGDDIMQYDTSVHDTISGGELIEIMTAVSVKLESGRTK